MVSFSERLKVQMEAQMEQQNDGRVAFTEAMNAAKRDRQSSVRPQLAGTTLRASRQSTVMAAEAAYGAAEVFDESTGIQAAGQRRNAVGHLAERGTAAPARTQHKQAATSRNATDCRIGAGARYGGWEREDLAWQAAARVGADSRSSVTQLQAAEVAPMTSGGLRAAAQTQGEVGPSGEFHSAPMPHVHQTRGAGGSSIT